MTDCIEYTSLIYGQAPDYPAWICSDCGDKWGRKECGDSTWHEGECGVCGSVAPVTEPRNYGYLKDGWKKGKRNDQ